MASRMKPGNSQRGAVFVLMTVVMLVLVLVFALAAEAFRMLTGKLQMENISEYAAEVDLDAFVRGEPPPSMNTASMNRLLSLVNNNTFMGQEASTAVSSEAICDSGMSCGSPIEVVRGCYAPDTEVFTPGSDPCGGSSLRAVYVRSSTFEERRFKGILTKLFNAASIELSTEAVAYEYVPSGGGAARFVTGPLRRGSQAS